MWLLVPSIKMFVVYVLLVELVVAIWPLPQHYNYGNSTLWLSPDVEYRFNSDQRLNDEPSWTTSGQRILRLDFRSVKTDGTNMIYTAGQTTRT